MLPFFARFLTKNEPVWRILYTSSTLSTKKKKMTTDSWHLTPDTWHLKYDIWWGVNILLKCQLPSPYRYIGSVKNMHEIIWVSQKYFIAKLTSVKKKCIEIKPLNETKYSSWIQVLFLNSNSSLILYWYILELEII